MYRPILSWTYNWKSKLRFIATIGAVGLVGLSINDSIIVLSHIKEEASNKIISKAEIIEVVIRSTRHIITTSVTSIGGFAPLIFTSVFFRPLAWAMTIGVLGATLLALLYIPTMFIVMNKIRNSAVIRTVDFLNFFKIKDS